MNQDVRANSYNFMFERVNFFVVSNKLVKKITTSGSNPSLLSMAKFSEEVKVFDLVYVLFRKDFDQYFLTPNSVTPLIN